MMVTVKAPRRMTFSKFATAERAAAFVQRNSRRFISIRYSFGFVIVNHYIR